MNRGERSAGLNPEEQHRLDGFKDESLHTDGVKPERLQAERPGLGPEDASPAVPFICWDFIDADPRFGSNLTVAH